MIFGETGKYQELSNLVNFEENNIFAVVSDRFDTNGSIKSGERSHR